MHYTDTDTGYQPGQGDAHDYIPEWMNVPGIEGTEGRDDPLAVVKLFTPDSNWTWYVVEYDPQEKLAFGLVVGFETEFGYFSIPEMEKVKGPLGLRIERDLWFEPQPITATPGYQARWGKHGGPYQPRPAEETAETDCPEPKFDIGDVVHFGWLENDTERHSIYAREWREDLETWAYKANGKWWSEGSLVPVEPEGDGSGPDADGANVEPEDQVWWEDDGNVLTGVVDYAAPDGDVTVKCDDHLTVAGGVPIGRIEHVALDRLHKGTPPVAEATLEPESEASEPITGEATGEQVEQQAENAQSSPPANESSAVEVDAEDGVPDFIEVDLGRTHGWATAAVERVRGKWLYYHLTREHCHKRDPRDGKVQVIARDILWRPAAPASRGGAQ